MRALVLSGGGSKGAFEVGALKWLSEQTQYAGGFPIISGTSVGALNGAALAMFNNMEFNKAAKYLHTIWMQDLRKLWKLKFPPYITGLWSNSLGNNNGLRKLVDNALDDAKLKTSGVIFMATAVDLLSGKAQVFNEDDKDIKKAVLASASFPVAFPPQQILDKTYTDGGVRDVAPLSAAIHAGAHEIVVISCSNPYNSQISKLPKNALSMLMRVIDLMNIEILFNDLAQCKHVNDNLDLYPGRKEIKLKVIFPTEELGDSLDFSHKLVEKRIALGYEAAKARSHTLL